MRLAGVRRDAQGARDVDHGTTSCKGSSGAGTGGGGVTAGSGRAQRWGGLIEEIRPGDVVWFSPGEKHWHGASPTTAMTHIAIQEKKDGKVVDWMEHVNDEQYSAMI